MSDGLQRLVRHGQRQRDVDQRAEECAAGARHDRRVAEAEATGDERAKRTRGALGGMGHLVLSTAY